MASVLTDFLPRHCWRDNRPPVAYKVLKDAGLCIEIFSASWARHLLNGIEKIAKGGMNE
jgi:hypothetical protein